MWQCKLLAWTWWLWISSWWRHQMETFSALLAICAGNSLVPGEFPTQRPVTRSFNVFLDLRLNKPLSKQLWGWWFESLSRPLRHRNVFRKRSSRKKHYKIDLFECYFSFVADKGHKTHELCGAAQQSCSLFVLCCALLWFAVYPCYLYLSGLVHKGNVTIPSALAIGHWRWCVNSLP